MELRNNVEVNTKIIPKDKSEKIEDSLSKMEDGARSIAEKFDIAKKISEMPEYIEVDVDIDLQTILALDSETSRDEAADNKSETSGEQNDDGVEEYKDDNGTVYRRGNELLPDIEYVINGYKYKTDEKGRIIYAGGKLRTTERDKRLPIKDSMDDIGGGDQKETDERGHLIADRFDGGNGLENIVAMDAELNNGDFKKLENYLERMLKAGNDVEAEVIVKHDGESNRPSEFFVVVTINGEKEVYVFPNKGDS